MHQISDSRFNATKCAEICIEKYRYQLNAIELVKMAEKQIGSLKRVENQNQNHWGNHQEERMRCRAGRSSFWVSWDGRMTACGMLSFPLEVYPFEQPFKECWMALTDKVRTTPVLRECAGCNRKEICKPCVAMLYAETGDVNKRSSYLCQFADCLIEKMQKIILEAKPKGEEDLYEKR